MEKYAAAVVYGLMFGIIVVFIIYPWIGRQTLRVLTGTAIGIYAVYLFVSLLIEFVLFPNIDSAWALFIGAMVIVIVTALAVRPTLWLGRKLRDSRPTPLPPLTTTVQEPSAEYKIDTLDAKIEEILEKNRRG